MSARQMFDAMNGEPPKGKVRRHGNKRRQLADLKRKARRAERLKLNRQVTDDE